MEHEKNPSYIQVEKTEEKTVTVTTEPDTSSATSTKETAKKITFIGIAILVLFLIAFGIVRILPTIYSAVGAAGTTLTSIFTPKATIEVTASPATLDTGDIFTLAWSNSNVEASGSYTFTYECNKEVSIEHTYPNGEKASIVCATPFTLPKNDNSLKFKIVFAEKDSFADVTLSVLFTNETNKDTVTGATTITVRNGSSYGPSTTPGVSVSTSTPIASRPTPTTPAVNGVADLAVINTQTGVINRSTNSFTPGIVQTGDRVGVQFEVTNIGNKATGAWKLIATLPTNPAQTYVSPFQVSLNPGDRLLFTLAFDDLIYAQDNTIAINIDSTNAVIESNEANNIVAVNVRQTLTGTSSSKPDLSIRLIDTGAMVNNAYVALNQIPNGTRGAIRFEVENSGNTASGIWYFRANLPVGDTFNSFAQTSLAAGEKKQFTLAFDTEYNRNNTITIRVDHTNNINEAKENNNDISASIRTR